MEDGDELPEPEAELRFGPEDRDETPLVGDDVTGDKMPSTQLSRLDGGLTSLADYEGRPMVVNVFASTCAPCLEEMPAFERVHQELGDQVAFVGLNFRDQLEPARQLVAGTGITYDVLRDPSGDLFTSLGGLNLPTTYFVSAEGDIVKSQPGALDEEELRREVAGLLDPE